MTNQAFHASDVESNITVC